MKRSASLILILALLLCLCACQNPIQQMISDDSQKPPAEENTEGSPAEKPEAPATGEGASATDAAGDDDALRALLKTMIEEKLGTKDATTGEEYTYTLGDRVTDSKGQEYFYGRWVRMIYDFDSKTSVPSLMAEFFITMDGEHCYVGNYFPNNAANGETVVLTAEDLFDPTAGMAAN